MEMLPAGTPTDPEEYLIWCMAKRRENAASGEAPIRVKASGSPMNLRLQNAYERRRDQSQIDPPDVPQTTLGDIPEA